MNRFLTGILLFAVIAACGGTTLVADETIDCADCEEWNQPQDAFRIYGNTYFVGVAGLSSILIDSGEGLILLDGALPQSAPLIAANIKQLGFALSDVKLIGSSHAHYDHVGGINALQRASGARVVARAPARAALLKGDLMPDDPQVTSRDSRFPALAEVDEIAGGEQIAMGSVVLTAIATPGHTPGGTSWTWQSCEEDRCLTIVYADSLSAVATPPFRFRNDKYAAANIRKSARTIARLECDIFLAPHPFHFDMLERLEQSGEDNPFIQSGCENYALNAVEQLDERLLQEMRF